MAQRNSKQQYHSGKNPDFFQGVGSSKQEYHSGQNPDFFQGVRTSKLQYHSGKSSMIPSRNRHFSTSDKVTSDKAQVGSKISAKNHAILWRIKLPTEKHSESYLYSGRGMRVATGTQKE
jgi:hypothetical protein